MPDFDVTSPDGKTFRVSAPEGATQEQALAYAKRNLPKAAPEKSTMSGMIGDVGAAIGGSIETLGRDFSSAFPTPEERKADLSQGLAHGLGQEASRAGSAFKLIPDVAGVIASPITGLAHATIGRGMHALTPKVPQEETNAQVDKAMMSMQPSRGSVGPPTSSARPGAEAARHAGYVLPPEMASSAPGAVAEGLGGWGGKIKTQQRASERNQEVTNRLAARALGVADDTTLNDAVFRAVRERAGRAYQAVADALPVVRSDNDFTQTIQEIGGHRSQAAQEFPTLMANPEIARLTEELATIPQFSARAGLDLVKELRFNAKENLKAAGDPQRHALGLAQREAAEAVDALIERRLAETGRAGLVEDYQAARQMIARSYDVEGATNGATGDVNAAGLARLANKGRPMTGDLLTISDAANAFPKAMQDAARFGGTGQHSALDFFGSALAIAHGNPSVAGAILGRPLARSAVLSPRMQRHMIEPRYPGPSAASPAIMNSAADALNESPDPATRALGAQ